MKKRLLSIDGGGIRGLIPALILSALEEKHNQPISQQFDMIAGTSTGGIIALGLTKKGQGACPALSAKELANIYLNEGKHIFQQSPWQRFKSLNGLRETIYSNQGLQKILLDEFGHSKLSESLCDILITSYDLERRKPHFFKSHRAQQDLDRDYYISDVGMATSAAPTYFSPCFISNINQTYQASLVDGGVYANNPTGCLLAEARRLYPETTEIEILSIGTGELIKPIMHQQACKWGKVGWVRPVLDIIFDGVADTVDYQLKQLSGKGLSYKRLQITLDEGSEAMDNIAPENLRALSYKAEQLIELL